MLYFLKIYLMPSFMQNIVEFFFNLSSLKLGIEICQEAIHPNMIRAKVKMRIIMEKL